MELGTLSMTISAETSKLQTSVANAKQVISSLADVTKDGSEDMQKAFDDALGRVNEEISKINDGIAKNQNVVKVLTDYYEKLGKVRDQALANGDKQSADQAEEKMAKTYNAIAQRQKLIEDSQRAVESLTTSMNKAMETEPDPSKWEQMSSILGSMDGAIGGVYKDMMKLVQASKLFITTGIGMVIGALALAFQALKSYLTGTAEGEEKLASITGYLSGVMNVFTDIIKHVGKYIWELGGKVGELWDSLKTNPLETITNGFKKLGSVIVNSVMKRFEGLSIMFTSFFSAIGKALQGEFSEAGELMKEAGSGLTQAITGFSTDEIVEGFNNVTEAIGETISMADEYGKKMAEISVREHRLEYEKSKWAIESAKIQEQINKNQQAMYTGTAKTRMKAGREMIALMQKQYQKEVEIAEKELQIQKDKMALSENTQADYLKQYQLEANVAQKRAQLQSAVAGVMRRLHSAEKEAIYEATQLKIDAMEEGFNKEQAQRDLNRQKAIDAIERDKEDYINAELDKARAIAKAKNEQFDEQSARAKIDTSDFDEDIFAQNQKYDYIDAQALHQALGEWRDYHEQRLEIESKYDQLITQARTDEETQGLQYAKEQAIKQLNESQLQGEGSEVFDAWKKSISNLGLTQLQRELDLLGVKMRELQESGMATDREIAQVTAQMEIIEEKLRSERFQLPSSVEEAWKDLRNSMQKTTQTIRGIGGAVADTLADIFDTASAITDSVFDSINNINKLVEVSTGAMETTSKTASSAIKAVEMASVILAIIGAIMQAVEAVIGLFSRQSKATKEYEEEAKTVQVLSEIWNQATEAKRAYYEEGGHSQSELKQNFEDEIKIIEGEIEAYRELARKRLDAGASIGSHSYDYRMWKGSYTFDGGKNWRDIAKEISEARGVAFSSMDDLTKMSAEDLRWIRENYAKAWASMDGDFRDLLNTIIDSESKLSEASEAYQQSILGTTWSDFRSEALSALTDVEVTAEDVASNINEAMRKALITDLFNTKYDAQLKAFYEKWQAMTESDGELSDAEREALQEEAKKLSEDAVKEIQGINSLFNNDEGSVTSLSGAIATASQESIDLLAGQTNAVRINQIDGLDIMRDQLAELTSIRVINTSMATFLDKILTKISGSTSQDQLRAMGNM